MWWNLFYFVVLIMNNTQYQKSSKFFFAFAFFLYLGTIRAIGFAISSGTILLVYLRGGGEDSLIGVSSGTMILDESTLFFNNFNESSLRNWLLTWLGLFIVEEMVYSFYSCFFLTISSRTIYFSTLDFSFSTKIYSETGLDSIL